MVDPQNILPWPSDTCRRHEKYDSSLSLKMLRILLETLAVVVVTSSREVEGQESAPAEPIGFALVVVRFPDQSLTANNG